MYLYRNIRQFTGNRRPPGATPESNDAEHASGTAQTLLRKVLVVDDEVDLADMAATLLNAHGLEVVVAYSAHEALRALEKEGDIDAVFSDIVMPGMTGLQLADVMKEMYPKVKVVLASGYTVPALLTERDRPYLYTPKPYKIDTILRLLRS
jgi:two-component system OmpR family response regulator